MKSDDSSSAYVLQLLSALQVKDAEGKVASAYWTDSKGSPVTNALKYVSETAYKGQPLKLCAQLEGTKTPTTVKFDLGTNTKIRESGATY